VQVILTAIMGIAEVLPVLGQLIKSFSALLADLEKGPEVDTDQLGSDARGAAQAAVDLVHTFDGQVALVEHVLTQNHPALPSDVRHTIASQAVTVERHKNDPAVKAAG